MAPYTVVNLIVHETWLNMSDNNGLLLYNNQNFSVMHRDSSGQARGEACVCLYVTSWNLAEISGLLSEIYTHLEILCMVVFCNDFKQRYVNFNWKCSNVKHSAYPRQSNGLIETWSKYIRPSDEQMYSVKL